MKKTSDFGGIFSVHRRASIEARSAISHSRFGCPAIHDLTGFLVVTLRGIETRCRPWSLAINF
jgi:hypothetical protein